MKEAMKSRLTSGTPRINSMKEVHKALTRGIRDRRPSASAIASGKAITMPESDSMSVSGRPPQRVLST